jgi:predicted MFS family arabinose efflux permease
VPGGVYILIGFVAGLPSPVRTGGFSGLIPTVVPEPVLPKAYGAEAVSYNVAGIAGPALAGAIAGGFGASWAIVATGVMALGAFIVVAQVPIEPAEAHEGHRIRESLRAGLGLLWRSRPLRVVTVATTVGQGWFGLMVVAYPLLAHQLGHARAAGGLLFSVFAVGALVGSVGYTKLAGRLGDQAVAMSMFGFVGAAFIGLAVAPSMGVAVLMSGIAGFFDGPMLAATLNLRQRLSPDVLRTQVFTTAASMKIGSFALGSALAGPAASAVGARGMLALVGAGQFIAVISGFAVAGRRKPASSLSFY